jgi:hypothetical protein
MPINGGLRTAVCSHHHHHRLHRHRYFGVFAPNSLLRTAVTALTLAATTAPPAANAEPTAEPVHRRVARYAWALLLARIYFRLIHPVR